MESAEIAKTVRNVRGFERPVVSLYANIHYGKKGGREAVAVRVKNTLRELGGRHDQELPEEIRERIQGYFAENTPQRRSLAVFASRNQLAVVELEGARWSDVESDRQIARLGDPYFAPLYVALNEHEPYAVVYCDGDHVLVFELAFGEAEEVLRLRRPESSETDVSGSSKDRAPHGVSNVKPADARSGHTLSQRQNLPHYIADRGDAAKQLFQERLERDKLEFFRECGGRIREFMADRTLRGAVILGTERDRHLLISVLPVQVSQRIMALLPSTVGTPPGPNDIVTLVQSTVDQLESERKAKLMDVVRETGVVGAEACVRALQLGRAHTVLIARSLNKRAFLNERTKEVTTCRSLSDARRSEPVTRVELMDVLIELAEKKRAQLEFIGGSAEQRLLREFDGVGAVLRW